MHNKQLSDCKHYKKAAVVYTRCQPTHCLVANPIQECASNKQTPHSMNKIVKIKEYADTDHFGFGKCYRIIGQTCSYTRLTKPMSASR